MNDDVYLRIDVFEAENKAVYTRIDACEDVLVAEIAVLNTRLEDARQEINELRNMIVRGWTIVGAVAAVGAVLLAFRGV